MPDVPSPLIVDAGTSGRPNANARTTVKRLTIPLERLLSAAGSTLMRSTTTPRKTSIALSFDAGETLEARRAAVNALLARGPIPTGAAIRATSIDINASPVATYAEASNNKARLLVDAGILHPDAVPAFVAVPEVLSVLKRASDSLAHGLMSQKGFVDVSASGLAFAGGVPTLITHEDGKPIVDVDADLVGVNIGDATARVATIARVLLPRTAHYVFAGEAGDTITTFEGVGVTLGLSTLSIFVVLARSWNACVLLLILERLRFARGAAW